MSVYKKKYKNQFYFTNDLFKDTKVGTENVAGKSRHFIELSQDSSSNPTRENFKRFLFFKIEMNNNIRTVQSKFSTLASLLFD